MPSIWKENTDIFKHILAPKKGFNSVFTNIYLPRYKSFASQSVFLKGAKLTGHANEISLYSDIIVARTDNNLPLISKRSVF